MSIVLSKRGILAGNRRSESICLNFEVLKLLQAPYNVELTLQALHIQ